VIIHIRSVNIEHSEAPKGPTPLENALEVRFPGTTASGGDDSVKVFSKVRGDQQWTYSPRLRSYLATWKMGHRVKPGWFWLKRIKTGD
jgi:hypothetical protein